MDLLNNFDDIFLTESIILNIIGKMLIIVLTIFLAWLFIKLGRKLIFRKLRLPKQVAKSKVETMKSLIFNLVKIIVIFIALVTILETLGINTNSILATAGIGGLAIGFGAQSIVKDYITGIFMIAEDQYRVGDFVIIEGFEGYVEEVGLRLTKIRGRNGNLHILQNGNIKAVTNQSKGPQRVWTEIYVSKSVPVDKVEEAIDKAIVSINEENEEDLVEEVTYRGINNITEFDAAYLLRGYVVPDAQWRVERSMRKHSLDELRKAGITNDDLAMKRESKEADYDGDDDRILDKREKTEEE